MANTTLPPGFRFHPTDVELIMYYLKRKVTGRKFPSEAKRAIPELNVRLYAPWELPGKSRSKDLEWYFFYPIEKKYASGSRTKRANETGYWKATGNDRSVTYKGRTVGKIKTLIFYQGQSRKGIRTDWVIHEYRMEDKHLAVAGIVQDSYVICKVFEKTGSGPKNGSQYGGPFIEEDWDNDDVCAETDLSGVSPAMLAPTDCQSCPVDIDSTSSLALVEPGPSSAEPDRSGVSPAILAPTDCQSYPVDIASTSSLALVEPGPSSAEPGSSLAEPHINEPLQSDDIIDFLHLFFPEDNGFLPIESNNNEYMSNLNQARSVEIAECNDGDDIYNNLGDLGNLPTLGEDGSPDIPNPQEETAYFGVVDPDTAYMELDDLSKPLDDSNCDSETQDLVRENLYPSYNVAIDVEQSNIRGNNTSGML